MIHHVNNHHVIQTDVSGKEGAEGLISRHRRCPSDLNLECCKTENGFLMNSKKKSCSDGVVDHFINSRVFSVPLGANVFCHDDGVV